MEGLSQGVDLIYFRKCAGDPEWYEAQLGADGILGIPFSVPTPTIWDLMERGEVYLGQYLERQVRALIERYGDARSPRPDPTLLEEAVA